MNEKQKESFFNQVSDELEKNKMDKNIKLKMEEEIKKNTFKIMAFNEFPYSEMKKILEKIEELNYRITLVDNGNIVCEKLNK